MGIQCMRAEVDIHPEPAFTYQHMIQQIGSTPINIHYRFQELLGRGSYSDVYRAECRMTGQERAIKKVRVARNPKSEATILNQFHILSKMDHPNILKMFQIYEDPTHFYIVTQLCKGHELFDYLYSCKTLTESHSAHIFTQLISAVRYLHERKVMHRDLKPENIIYDPSTKTIKLVDFGSAIAFQSEELQQRKRAGTSYYIAPEVIDRKYNHKCDVWSAGVILYIMLSGEPPYNGKNDSQIMEKIKKTDLIFKQSLWSKISEQAKNLIRKMMSKDVNNRPEMLEIMEDPWITAYMKQRKFDTSNAPSMTDCLSNMKKFKKVKSTGIESGVLVFMVNFIKKPDDEVQMRKCFQQLDLNGDGVLSVEQLAQGLIAFYKCSARQAKALAESIFKAIDTNNSGYIEYSQFLVSASQIELVITQQNLELAFDWMDEDHNGALSTTELRNKLGKHIEEDSYRQLIKQAKLNEHGQISKQCFLEMMGKLLTKK